MSRVSRFKICTYELGERSLSSEELTRVIVAIQSEADRLRRIAGQIVAVDQGSREAQGDGR
jgi:hypothetical protein